MTFVFEIIDERVHVRLQRSFQIWTATGISGSSRLLVPQISGFQAETLTYLTKSTLSRLLQPISPEGPAKIPMCHHRGEFLEARPKRLFTERQRLHRGEYYMPMDPQSSKSFS